MYWRFSTVFRWGAVYNPSMKRSTPAVFAVAASLAFAACTSDFSVGQRTQSIINGTVDSSDAAVVLIFSQVPNSQFGSLCTGEIISPHVVLTAAHCVDPATVGSGAKFFVFPGTQLTMHTSGADFLAVAEVHYDMAFNPSDPTAGHDVGVVILQAPTAIPPVAYNRTPLPQSMVGQPARLVGYGVTQVTTDLAADSMTAGTRRQAPSKLASIDGIVLNFLDMQHNICEGDSGGPAFMNVNGREMIVGVTSYGYQGCPLSAPGTDTRVDVYADFIDPWVLKFDPPSKGPGDSCSSDSECVPRTCDQTSVGKICAQACDPVAMPSTCPTGTQCTGVDGQTLCVKPSGDNGGGGKSGGCDVGGGAASGAGLGLLLLGALAIWMARRRVRS